MTDVRRDHLRAVLAAWADADEADELDLRPPAPADHVEAVRRHLGGRLPQGLDVLWSLADGGYAFDLELLAARDLLPFDNRPWLLAGLGGAVVVAVEQGGPQWLAVDVAGRAHAPGAVFAVDSYAAQLDESVWVAESFAAFLERLPTLHVGTLIDRPRLGSGECAALRTAMTEDPTGWLGLGGASIPDLHAAEVRLGHILPRGLRELLAFCDGPAFTRTGVRVLRASELATLPGQDGLVAFAEARGGLLYGVTVGASGWPVAGEVVSEGRRGRPGARLGRFAPVVETWLHPTRGEPT